MIFIRQLDNTLNRLILSVMLYNLAVLCTLLTIDLLHMHAIMVYVLLQAAPHHVMYSTQAHPAHGPLQLLKIVSESKSVHAVAQL